MNNVRIKLTDALLEQVIGAVSERTGNVVGQKQINMIESRLTKRALTLGLANEAEYLEYFKKNRATELEDLISLLTVHHTFFFREFSQFEYLGATVLPRLLSEMKTEGRNKIRIWSAACSRGQETYSLFMYVDQYLKTNAPGISVEILGTDVDRESVKIADNGVYPWDDVKEIPLTLLSQYWARGSGDVAKFAKIKEVARKACTFKQNNLMETNAFSVHGKFDIIFCRNVFIYFQASDITRISDALAAQLLPKGFFFVGLSESLPSAPKGLNKRGPSIYGPELVEVAKVKASPTASPAQPLRVFCVDDSQTILKLLKSILTTAHGFEVVATAGDGLESAKLVEQGLKFDIMTLDVHMPNMTGVEYLERKVGPSHPPIVMLTSASRDNMDLAYKAMALGAKDYIEKPSLSDLAKRSDEIRSKLRLVSQSKNSAQASDANLSLEKQFKTSMNVKQTNDKVNVLFADERTFASVVAVLKDRTFTDIASVVVDIGDGQSSGKLISRLNADPLIASRFIPFSASLAEKKISHTTLPDFKRIAASAFANKSICYSVFSNLNRSQWEACPKSRAMKILIGEDIDRSVFLSYLSFVFVTPATSFAYMSNEFFGKVDQKLAG